MLDERLYTIETPEQIDVAYDVAGIGSRFLAALIDHVILGVFLALSCTGLSLAASQLELGLDDAIVLSLLGIGVYLLLCAYYIFFETIWNGQTPGKRMIGLRMVRTGGRPIGFLGSTVRNFIRLADFLPLLYGLGMLVMFIDKRSRRLGDLAAGCMAVRERQAVTLQSLTAPVLGETPVVQAAPVVTIPNLGALRHDDYEIVQEYLRRMLSLNFDARQRLVRQLIEGLQQRLGYPLVNHWGLPLIDADGKVLLPEAEAFLRMVAAEYLTMSHVGAAIQP